MSKGWIKLHRQIFDNVIYTDKPFCRPMAFIDLLLRASHIDKDMFFNGNVITLKRGSFVTSYDKLSDRWGWSTSKIRRYLKELVKLNMIQVISDQKKTVISLINFDVYQGDETTENIHKNYEKISEDIQKNTINNDKNLENDNNDIYIGQTDFDKVMYACSKKSIHDAITQPIAIKQYMQNLTMDEMMDCIQRSANKPVAYLLKVLKTKTDDKQQNKVKPFVSKNPRKATLKPKLQPASQVNESLTDSERKELDEAIKKLEGADS